MRKNHLIKLASKMGVGYMEDGIMFCIIAPPKKVFVDEAHIQCFYYYQKGVYKVQGYRYLKMILKCGLHDCTDPACQICNNQTSDKMEEQSNNSIPAQWWVLESPLSNEGEFRGRVVPFASQGEAVKHVARLENWDDNMIYNIVEDWNVVLDFCKDANLNSDNFKNA